MPETEEMKFFFRGETIMMRSFLPESNTLRKSVISLGKSSDQHQFPHLNRPESMFSNLTQDQHDGIEQEDEMDFGGNPDDLLSKGWRRRTGRGSGWIDVWSVPVLILNISYQYHPIPAENEMTRRIRESLGEDYSNMKSSDLDADVLTIELEAGPSAIRQFGFFWRQFLVGMKVRF